jgi:stage II sporulation protein D
MTRRAHRAVVVALVVGAIGVVPGVVRSAPHRPRRPAGHFVFHGSGYGHGLGMSQYGALGLAKKGWPVDKIIRHYYRGVAVGQRQPESTIRVGLLQAAASARVIATVGAYDLVLQSGEVVDTVPEGQRRKVEVTGDQRFRILRADGTEVATVGGPGTDLVARLQPGARARVPEWGHELGHGEVRFEVSGPGRAHVLGVMAVEDYVLGVSEMPNSWPRDALGVQAIASRTYAYWRLAGALRSDCACDVYTSTADQVFVGWDKEASSLGDRWVQAVKATDRTVATYKGDPIYAAYSSSSGGYTENIENVWPGAAPHPYLRGVCDPGDDVAENPNRLWRATFPSGSVTSGLHAYTGSIGTVTGFADWDFGVSGRVTAVRVMGTKGASMIEGWDVRTGLSLRDTRFSVNRNLNITGSIRAEYDRLGCRPGRATGAGKRVPGGREQSFVKGRLYQNDRKDEVTWLRGAVLGTYLDQGGPRGRLRLPYRYKKVVGGAKAWFDGGAIVCTPGCRVRFR